MAKKIDLTGQKIGKWTVLHQVENRGKRTFWLCECDCGNKKEVATAVLRNEESKSCGCSTHENKIGYNTKDLTGQKFGRLKVIKKCGISSDGRLVFLCKCDCGNQIEVIGRYMVTKHTLSCGCLRKEITSEKAKIHGFSHDRLYKIWASMKQRCSDENNSYYGGRGIDVYEEWANNYDVFRFWALTNGYEDNLSIERIDVNKGYNPDNCKWIPLNHQSKNRRSNVIINYNGEEKIISEWASYFDKKHSAIQHHLRKGTIEKAFNRWSKNLKNNA